MEPLLEGHDPARGIVGIQPLDGGTLRVFHRHEGETVTDDVPFYPFFHLSDPSLLDGFRPKHWLKRLEGSGFFTHLCVTEEWSRLWEALRHVLDRYNRSARSPADTLARLPVVHFSADPVTQYLLQSGRTFFKELAPGEVRRMQIDIETYTVPPHGFSSAQRPADRIILIALSDSTGWETVLDGRRLTEREMLQRLAETVRARDPDVIEGHNLLGFDLPYLQDRAALLGLTLDLGRVPGGRTLVDSRPGSAERFPDRTGIPGRQVVDTYHLVQSYDAAHRVLESHSLKAAARHFGLSAPDRTHVAGDRISWHWDHDPEPLVRYALDDVRETRLLSERLGASSFFLAQMLPLPPGAVVRTGAAAKIESLLLRAYLRARHAIPAPTPGQQTSGGYTDIFLTGVAEPVVHVDVESLYPSLMLARGIRPAADTLGVFPSLLRDLTALRLDAKRRVRTAQDPAERSRLDALQGSFKILINSFYGYLGYSRGLFNDPAAADAVTRAGQETLRTMIAAVTARGGTVVEVDTDGVFFIPPPGGEGPEAAERFAAALSAALPGGISVVADGVYPAMLSYKKKNYALLTGDGSVVLRGSSLISRSMERFGRAFIRGCVERMLRRDIAGLRRLYVETEERIRLRRMDIRELARSETLHETLEDYTAGVRAGTRNRSAAYEVAAARPVPVRPGDRIAFYVAGTDPAPRGWEHCKPAEEWDPHFPDENTAWYLRRLREFAEKFSPFFSPRDFHAVFGPEDLFPFNPGGIRIITAPVVGTGIAREDEEEGEP